MLRHALLAITCIAVFLALAFPVRAHDPRPDEPQPRVQIALLLDTSNSMDGLINQAKTQLWKIVNEFNKAKKHGQPPRLEVALYQYGNDSLLVTEGFVQQVVPFTDDLDLISEKLFALRTNGGEEYCGTVIQKSFRQLEWSSDPSVFKAIYIAGNEPFTQGSVDYREACVRASENGVIINTIHCGAAREGVEGRWADGARIGGGKAMNINADRVRPTIHCPQDGEISRLSEELNKTYIPYGKAGVAGAARQKAQDVNAEANASVGSDVQRALAKASGAYQNAGWDLVDAVTNNAVKLEDLDDKDLPEVMQAMSTDARRDYLKQQQMKRGEIQKKIFDLNAEREKIVAAEEKKLAEKDGEATLDTAIGEMVREQLQAKEFDVP